MTTAAGTPPPDHHIGDTEHGTLYFADGTVTVVADWRIIEEAPDSDGRIYRTPRGFTVNSTHGPLADSPFREGNTRLTHVDLCGTPLVDTDVVCRLALLSAPQPNTWDHPGYVVSVLWLERNVNPLWWQGVLDAVRANEAEQSSIAELWKSIRESDQSNAQEAARPGRAARRSRPAPAAGAAGTGGGHAVARLFRPGGRGNSRSRTAGAPCGRRSRPAVCRHPSTGRGTAGRRRASWSRGSNSAPSCGARSPARSRRSPRPPVRCWRRSPT